MTIEEINVGKAPFILPFFGHRFLVFDSNEQVLSMFGEDIILWSHNLAKGVAKDIFNFYDERIDSKISKVDFWLDEVE